MNPDLVAEAIFRADRMHFGHELKAWAERGESEREYWRALADAAIAAGSAEWKCS